MENMENKSNGEDQSNEVKSSNSNTEINEEPEYGDDWLDVLGSGALMKKIHKEGSGEKPNKGDAVVLSVKTYLKEGDTLVDDNKKLEFVLGDGDVIRALELTVSLMLVGEECEIILQSKLGYKEFGLKPNIPPNADLKIFIHFISNDGPLDYEKMSAKDKSSICNAKRDNGNSLYSRGDYSDAIQCYTKALTILDTSGEAINDSQEDLQELLEIKVKCHTNLAAAQLKVGAYDAAEQSCSLALAIQPDNVKALFRKAKALINKGELEQASELMKKALSIDPSERAIHYEQAKLLSRIREQNNSQKKIYQRMFGGPHNPSNSDAPASKQVF
ncbi:DgyrCDS11175 [Dimorphilus gyrociliatus]|uniref:peptidylprolyl isomerase n=1 Tax=Dimorphilus gyrociliatus TaxID=2664684 RepID=A0A7I8W2P3_9ANNE|nr:DgyrCDS11175 [Dimorphilus gyrociliatus]